MVVEERQGRNGEIELFGYVTTLLLFLLPYMRCCLKRTEITTSLVTREFTFLITVCCHLVLSLRSRMVGIAMCKLRIVCKAKNNGTSRYYSLFISEDKAFAITVINTNV